MTTPHTGDSSSGTGGGPRSRGGGGGRLRRVLAAFGRCLAAFGAMHIALADPHPADPHPPGGTTPHDTTPHDTAPGGTAGGAAWWDGPPPAHPERLCGERPLTEQELRLARQLWPASYPQRRDRGR